MMNGNFGLESIGNFTAELSKDPKHYPKILVYKKFLASISPATIFFYVLPPCNFRDRNSMKFTQMKQQRASDC
jgi:hypothetical protein